MGAKAGTVVDALMAARRRESRSARHPALMLREEMEARRYTAKDVAAAIDIPVARVEAALNVKAPLDGGALNLISDCLGIEAGFFAGALHRYVSRDRDNDGGLIPRVKD